MTKEIEVLGTGCSKCQTFAKLVKEVIEENNIDATFEKVEDIMKIMEYKVMATPALVVNGEVVSKGRIPSKEEILGLITN